MGLNRNGFNPQWPPTSGQNMFIDQLSNGSFPAPAGTGWSSAPTWNSGILDASGWPCTNQVNVSCPYGGGTNPVNGGARFLSGVLELPATANYGGIYCVQGKGSATIQFGSFVTGTPFSISGANSQTCAGFNGSASNCRSSNVTVSNTNPATFTTADDTWSGWCIAVTAPADQIFSTAGNTQILISNIDPNSNGHYVKDIHFYQIGDGADLAAGKLYRSAWLSQVVSFDPGFVRFLNFAGYTNISNLAASMRFTERPTPVNHPYGGTQSNVAGLLPYGLPTTVSRDHYSIAAVSGTPASMAHGESVVFVPNDTPISGTGLSNVTSIGIAGTTVTLGVNSNMVFQTGDTVVMVNMPAGDSNLNQFFATSITVDSSTQLHFTFANAASLSTCSSSCGTVAMAFYLQVGSGNDRTAYPVYDLDGQSPWAVNTLNGPATNGVNMERFCFDKRLIGSYNGSGTPSYGAWYWCGWDSEPLEFQVELINELNAMSPAHVINGYFHVPLAGLVCSTYYSDPDCSSSVDWPANEVNVIMNGANGYSGLCAQCWAIMEFANETWNSGFKTTSYLGQLSAQPATVGKWGCGNGSIDGYAVIEAELIANDINNSGFTHGRVANTLGGWQFLTSVSIERAVGGVSAPFNVCQPAPVDLVPIRSLFTFMNVAPYFSQGGPLGGLPGTNWSSGTTYSAGQVVLYFGNAYTSLVNSNVGNAPDSSPTQWETRLRDLSTQWASDVNSFGFGSSQAISDLAALTGEMTTGVDTPSSIINSEGRISTVATAIAPYGQKYVIGYEGWWETDPAPSWGLITSQPTCTGGTVTMSASMFRGGLSSPTAVQGVSVAGYNGVFTTTGGSGSFTYTAPGGTCPVGTPAVSMQGGYGYVMPQDDAYQNAARNSSAWATDYVNYLNWAASQANVGMPGFFIQSDLTWGVTFPDTYGTTSTEGNGNNASWTAIGAANRGRAN